MSKPADRYQIAGGSVDMQDCCHKKIAEKEQDASIGRSVCSYPVFKLQPQMPKPAGCSYVVMWDMQHPCYKNADKRQDAKMHMQELLRVHVAW